MSGMVPGPRPPLPPTSTLFAIPSNELPYEIKSLLRMILDLMFATCEAVKVKVNGVPLFGMTVGVWL